MVSIVSCMLDLGLCIVVVFADNFDNFESDNWMVFDGMTEEFVDDAVADIDSEHWPVHRS